MGTQPTISAPFLHVSNASSFVTQDTTFEVIKICTVCESLHCDEAEDPHRQNRSFSGSLLCSSIQTIASLLRRFFRLQLLEKGNVAAQCKLSLAHVRILSIAPPMRAFDRFSRKRPIPPAQIRMQEPPPRLSGQKCVTVNHKRLTKHHAQGCNYRIKTCCLSVSLSAFKVLKVSIYVFDDLERTDCLNKTILGGGILK